MPDSPKYWAQYAETGNGSQRLKRTGYYTAERPLDRKPLTPSAERLRCGGYYAARYTPAKLDPFKDSLTTGDATGFRLRMEYAGEAYRHTTAYYGDDDGYSLFVPIVARLPKSRGWLAGYLLSDGDCFTLDYAKAYDDRDDARHAAHHFAERSAETEREYQREETEREDAEREAEEAAEREAEAKEAAEEAERVAYVMKWAAAEHFAIAAEVVFTRNVDDVPSYLAKAAQRFHDTGYNDVTAYDLELLANVKPTPEELARVLRDPNATTTY